MIIEYLSAAFPDEQNDQLFDFHQVNYFTCKLQIVLQVSLDITMLYNDRNRRNKIYIA